MIVKSLHSFFIHINTASETEGISIQCGSSVVSEGLYHLTVIITLTESISTFGKLSFTCSAENGVLSTAMGRTNVTVEGKVGLIIKKY